MPLPLLLLPLPLLPLPLLPLLPLLSLPLLLPRRRRWPSSPGSVSVRVVAVDVVRSSVVVDPVVAGSASETCGVRLPTCTP